MPFQKCATGDQLGAVSIVAMALPPLVGSGWLNHKLTTRDKKVLQRATRISSYACARAPLAPAPDISVAASPLTMSIKHPIESIFTTMNQWNTPIGLHTMNTVNDENDIPADLLVHIHLESPCALNSSRVPVQLHLHCIVLMARCYCCCAIDNLRVIHIFMASL